MTSKCGLIFSSDLYVGDSVISTYDNVNFVINLLKQQKSILDIYLLCKSEGSACFLEIIHSAEIFKAVYKRRQYLVVGIAQGKKEAYEMVAEIYLKSTDSM